MSPGTVPPFRVLGCDRIIRHIALQNTFYKDTRSDQTSPQICNKEKKKLSQTSAMNLGDNGHVSQLRRRVKSAPAIVFVMIVTMTLARYIFLKEYMPQGNPQYTDAYSLGESVNKSRCYAVLFSLDGIMTYELVKYNGDEYTNRKELVIEFACLPSFITLRPPTTNTALTKYLIPLLQFDEGVQLPFKSTASITGQRRSQDDWSGQSLSKGSESQDIISPLTTTDTQLRKYLPQWPVMLTLREWHNIDLSDDYLASPLAYSRAKTVLGDSPRFIVWLKNPIDLLWALYQKTVRQSNPLTNFDEWVLNSAKLLPKETISDKDKDERPKWIESLPQSVRDVFVTGMYDVHLYQWMREFPKDNFIFIQEESIQGNEAHFKQKISDFVHYHNQPSKLNEESNSQVAQRIQETLNTKVASKAKLHMKNDTYALITRLYLPHVERLKKIIGLLSSGEWVEWI